MLIKIIEQAKCIKNNFKRWTIQTVELIIMAIVFITALIVILVVEDDESQAALEILLYGLILGFLYMAVRFYSEYKYNENARKSQIHVYSPQIMPMFKYEAITGKQGKMVEINAEYIYFFSAALLILIASLLSGILLDEEDRYIGFAVSAFVVVVVSIYVIRNANKAT